MHKALKNAQAHRDQRQKDHRIKNERHKKDHDQKDGHRYIAELLGLHTRIHTGELLHPRRKVAGKAVFLPFMGRDQEHIERQHPPHGRCTRHKHCHAVIMATMMRVKSSRQYLLINRMANTAPVFLHCLTTCCTIQYTTPANLSSIHRYSVIVELSKARHEQTARKNRPDLKNADRCLLGQGPKGIDQRYHQRHCKERRV